MKEENDYFPLFISLKEKRILIVGAGKIAARRAPILRSFGAKLFLVSPKLSVEMESVCTQGSVENLVYRKRCFEENDLAGMDMVLAATDDVALNHEIAMLCKQKEIPVNNASCKEDCDFFFPAILRQDGLTIGVSSSGSDHKKVARVSEQLRRFFLNAF